MKVPRLLTSPSFAAEINSNYSQSRKSYWQDIAKKASFRKNATQDVSEKNRLWFIGTLAGGSAIYLDAYREMKSGRYMDGWCTLEQAELAFSRLKTNPFVSELGELVARRAQLISQWQSTFPYRFFASPGMIYKRWSCSICGKQSTPIEPCGHIPTKVYAGELCTRIIHEAVPLEVSIVTDPVQKYSVLQLDHYQYDVVQYVLDHLVGPFDVWSGEWTHKRNPHDLFTDRPPNGPCPCNSKLRYEECCLLTDGVLLPYFLMKVPSQSKRGLLDERHILASGTKITRYQLE